MFTEYTTSNKMNTLGRMLYRKIIVYCQMNPVLVLKLLLGYDEKHIQTTITNKDALKCVAESISINYGDKTMEREFCKGFLSEFVEM